MLLTKYLVKVPANRNIFNNDGTDITLRFGSLKESDIIRESHVRDLTKFEPNVRVHWIGEILYISYDIITDLRGKLINRSNKVYVEIRR